MQVVSDNENPFLQHHLQGANNENPFKFLDLVFLDLILQLGAEDMQRMIIINLFWLLHHLGKEY